MFDITLSEDWVSYSESSKVSERGALATPPA
jgi:hypothetical protein